MKPQTFIKTFLVFVVVLLVPLVLFCVITVSFTQQQTRNTAEETNYQYLQQIRFNTEIVLNQINQLSLAYDLNTDVGYQLDQALQQKGSTYSGNKVMGIVRAFSSAESLSRPYIHSINIYFDYSPDRFFSSSSGITDRSNALDTQWIDSYRQKNADVNLWTEIRQVRKYIFEPPTTILTIYRRTFSRPGVIALNLLPEVLENELYSVSIGDTVPYMVVLNENGNAILENQNYPFTDILNLADLRGPDEESFTLTIDKTPYVVSRLVSEEYGWTYLAIIPQSSLYRLSSRILGVFLSVLVLCMVLGLLLAVWFTRRNYVQMKNVMEIFDSAESGKPLPRHKSGYFEDEYSVLTDNLIKTFVEQQYMKVSLSEKQFHLKALELMALQSQINPHFLFNTLKTIYWKAYALSDGPNDVSTMIEALSSTLSYSLDDPYVPVTIAEELQQTRNYLDIQMIRYPNKFSVDFCCDETLLKYQVLRLIIQPLVENSLQHGILQQEKYGLLRIRLSRRGELLRFVITDNGIGMNQVQIEHLHSQMNTDGVSDLEGRHIGLRNTFKRLKLKYGDQASLRIRSKPGLGTSIVLELPILPNDDGV